MLTVFSKCGVTKDQTNVFAILCHFQLLISSYSVKLQFIMPKHISISPEWPDWALAEPAPEFLRASSRTASLWLSAESTGPESNKCSRYWIRSLLLNKLYTVYKTKNTIKKENNWQKNKTKANKTNTATQTKQNTPKQKEQKQNTKQKEQKQNTKQKIKISNLSAFIMKALKETLQELISVVDTLSIFTHNPNHGSSSVWLIQRVQVFTQSGNYALIPAQTTERCFKLPINYMFFHSKSTFYFSLDRQSNIYSIPKHNELDTQHFKAHLHVAFMWTPHMKAVPKARLLNNNPNIPHFSLILRQHRMYTLQNMQSQNTLCQAQWQK